MADQVASALEAAHASNILHRDITPANVFLTAHNGAKLLDFGLAKRRPAGPMYEEPTTGVPFSREGQVVGTLGYLSPEQARGEAVDDRSDLFAFGAVLYEALTGSRAFDGSTAAVVYDAILNRQPVAPSLKNQQCPPELDGLVARLLSKHPMGRPSSATLVREELAKLRAHAARRLIRGQANVAAKRRVRLAAAAGVVFASLASSFMLFRLWKGAILTPHDMIVLADFRNDTNQAILSGALQQALTMNLESSPYLNVVPAKRVISYRSGESHQEDPVDAIEARSFAARTGSRAILQGTVTPRDAGFVVRLEVSDASSGALLATQESRVVSVQRLPEELTRTSFVLRHDLGESWTVIHESQPRNPESTSISCLNLMNRAGVLDATSGTKRAIDAYREAVRSDSNSVTARLNLAVQYFNIGDDVNGRVQLARAFTGRNQLSLNHRLLVEAFHALHAEGDVEEYLTKCEDLFRRYPRSRIGSMNAAIALSKLGRLDEAADRTWRAVQLDTGAVQPRLQFAAFAFHAGRIAQAESTLSSLNARVGPDDNIVYYQVLARMFEGDQPGVDRLLEAYPGFGDRHLDLLEIMSGLQAKPRAVRAISERATAGIRGRRFAELRLNQAFILMALEDSSGAAKLLRKVDLNDLPEGRRLALMYARALAGDTTEVRELTRGIASATPRATLVNRYDRPCIEAALSLRGGDPGAALGCLDADQSFDLAKSASLGAGMEPVYLRARALAQLGRHQDAISQYERLYGSRYVSTPSMKPVIALLGVAREQATLGHVEESRVAYEKLLRIWRHAEADCALVMRVRSELAKVETGASASSDQDQTPIGYSYYTM